MYKPSTRLFLLIAALALFIVPVVAFAAGGFTDVGDDNVFKADIQWMKDTGVTKGCNPPTNDKFCPGDNVTREQMSAFMHRLAVNKVVDAATAVNADKLDGKDSSAFLGKTEKAADADKLDGKDSTAFLNKSIYDPNEDGVVDAAEVKIRYEDDFFYLDMAFLEADRMQCVTAAVTFDATTTVTASGGLNLDPIATSTVSIYGYVYYSTDDRVTWTRLNGFALEGDPPGGTGDVAVPINSSAELGPGTYEFAIRPIGSDHRFGDDYSGRCELTVTAYVGLGEDIDAVLGSAGLAGDEVRIDD